LNIGDIAFLGAREIGNIICSWIFKLSS
jgi:hypothetical protein